jgi:hypothetical protein
MTLPERRRNMPTTTIKYLDDEGDEVEVTMPCSFAVCRKCEGTGKIVNPDIEPHGITREEFDADPDFEEGYFSGRYDIQCPECKGVRVTPEIDESKMTDEQKKQYKEYIAYCQAEVEYQNLCRIERLMGA